MNTRIKVVLMVTLMLAMVKLPAQTLQTLFSFSGTNGANPYSSITIGSDGNLYGTTVNGGAFNYGTVFQMTTNGMLTTLAVFDGTNGAEPYRGLTEGPDGNFYGTTYSGGSSNYGTIYKVGTSGTLVSLFSFQGTNGAHPDATMTLGNDGNFYGTTYEGGKGGTLGNNGMGTVFSITTNGTFKMLFAFEYPGRLLQAGAWPCGALTPSPDGNFYGTTSGGGGYDAGTVFKITTNGTMTTLVSFFDTGPYRAFDSISSVIVGQDGAFYGTTVHGGSRYAGSVFRAITNNSGRVSGTVVTKASFNVTNGTSPKGLTVGKEGNFYGITSEGGSKNYGTIFQTTTNGTLTMLCSFDGNNGKYPQAILTLANDGSFYGTTRYGGSNGYGTVFRFTLAPVLTAQFAGGAPVLSLYGPLGHNYGLQCTADLANWVDLLSITNSSTNQYQFTDSEGFGQPSRFYRAVIK